MTTPSPRILVSRHDPLICIKITGRANFNSSMEFKNLVNELIARDYRQFVLDLEECQIMDSTFLGMLAGLGMKLNKSSDEKSFITLVNPNARISELLDNLGVSQLFTTVQESELPDREYQETPQKETDKSKEEVTRNCLEAHKILMELNEANQKKFKEVTRFLEEDLRKHHGGKGAS